MEPVAMKTGAADADDVKDKKTEGDKKHKQRRWSEMPDDNSSSKISDEVSAKPDKEADTRSLEKKELMHTADRALLLACVYFDQSHAGYLLDRDVEDIIHTTGLQLSRAQVKKLVSQSLHRDQFNYRRLTDRPVVDKQAAGTETEQQNKTVTDDQLSAGNLLWLKSLHSSVITDKTPASQHTDSDAAAAAAGDSANDVVVLVNGALVNINSVLQNLSKSEEERSQMENEWKNMEQECVSLRRSLSSSEETEQTLSRELDVTKSQLSSVQHQLNTVEHDCRQRAAVLSHATATLTSLADQMNKVITVNDKRSSSSVSTE